MLEKQNAEYLDSLSTNLLQWEFMSMVIDLCFHKTGRFHDKPNNYNFQTGPFTIYLEYWAWGPCPTLTPHYTKLPFHCFAWSRWRASEVIIKTLVIDIMKTAFM
jgi:hypothetical protein